MCKKNKEIITIIGFAFNNILNQSAFFIENNDQTITNLFSAFTGYYTTLNVEATMWLLAGFTFGCTKTERVRKSLIKNYVDAVSVAKKAKNSKEMKKANQLYLAVVKDINKMLDLLGENETSQ